MGETDQTRTVTHFHYIAWPDNGLPSTTKSFLDLVDLADQANGSSGPLIVHCSAGLGRSGTFIAVHSILKHVAATLKANPSETLKFSLNLPQTILHFRKDRPGLVQNSSQYLFCWLAIRDGLKQKGLIKVEKPVN